MLQSPLFLSFVTALGFGGWPLVARAIGLPPLGIAILLSVGTLALVSFVGPVFFPWTTISGKTIFLGLGIGVINGFAFLAYSKLVATLEWDVSTYVPVALALMLIVPAIGGPLFFKEDFSVEKFAGIVSILIGIYLLR